MRQLEPIKFCLLASFTVALKFHSSRVRIYKKKAIMESYTLSPGGESVNTTVHANYAVIIVPC